MAVYEGKWRCPSCQTVNPGRFINCVSCGKKIDDSVEYFLDDNPTEVNDAKLLNLADQDENWICSHCQGSNRADFITCSSCGNPRDSDDKQLIAETRNNYKDWSENNTADYSESVKNLTYTAPSAGQRIGGLLNKYSIFTIIGFIILAGYLGSRLINPSEEKAPVSRNYSSGYILKATPTPTPTPTPRTVEVEVFDLEWSTSIDIEELKTETNTDWDKAVPSDAEILDRQKVIRSYEKVQTGTKTTYETYRERERDGTESYTERVSDGTESYKCGVINKRNGFFEDKYCTRTKYKTVTRTRPKYSDVTKTRPVQEPVYEDRPIYDTKVTYQTSRWISVDSADKNGRGWKASWAKPFVPQGRRTGKRSEQYKVIFHDNGNPQNSFSKNLQPSELKNFTKGKRFTALIDYRDEILSVKDIN